MDSILTSIKKMIGIVEEDDAFDPDIIMHINTVLMILSQLGITCINRIEDAETTWDEFGFELPLLEGVKTYMFLKVKLMFDPPTSSAVLESINRMVDELEWRLRAQVD